MPDRAAPVLAKVIKAYEGAGANKYACDVQVLKTGTLEETDRIIAEVPISPIWAAKKKRGVYAIPPVGQIVIVSFIGWSAAFPYIAGIWEDEYEADDFKAEQFIISDGDKLKITVGEKKLKIENGDTHVSAEEEKITVATNKTHVIMEGEKITVDSSKAQVIVNDDKIAVKNGSKSLFTILDTHFQNLIAMQTVGSPANHTVDPASIQKFVKDKTDLSLLMEP